MNPDPTLNVTENCPKDGVHLYHRRISVHRRGGPTSDRRNGSKPVRLFGSWWVGVRAGTTADGQRFLVTTFVGSDVSDPATATPRINVILNWFEELKQRVPTGR